MVYPSGHGFGHASRDFEVAIAMHQLDPNVRIHIRTTVADWFVRSEMRGVPCSTSEASLDVGIMQSNSLTQNIDHTVQRCEDLISQRDMLLKQEREFLRELRATMVLTDIPAIPLAAAAEENIHAIAMSNFTWSWIYDDLSKDEPALRGISDAFAADYRRAELFLRLPFHGAEAMSGVFNRVEDTPMIARVSTRSRAETLRMLELDGDAAPVLVSFGGLGAAHFDWRSLVDLERYVFLVTPPIKDKDIAQAPNLRLIDPTQLSRSGLQYSDLVAASEIVVTKPGYGIVSECLANETRMLYTSRGQFAEYPVLVEGVERYGVAQFISNEELLSGQWERALDALMARPRIPCGLPSNGAEFVARRLLSMR